MESEVERLRARYAQLIEDGRKIDVFTSMPEYQWFIEHVLEPTVADYTNRIIEGKTATDKEDWILRGMIQGIRLFIDTPVGFKKNTDEAKRKAKELQGVSDE